MDASIKIHGFEVDFNEYDDTNNVTICKDEYSGSLALLMHLGGLEDDCGNLLEVSQDTIDKIEKWSIGKGY